MSESNKVVVSAWMDGFLSVHHLGCRTAYLFSSYRGSPHNKYHDGYMLIRVVEDDESLYPHDVFAIVPIGDFDGRDELGRCINALGYIEVSGWRTEHEGVCYRDVYTVVNPIPKTVLFYDEVK